MRIRYRLHLCAVKIIQKNSANSVETQKSFQQTSCNIPNMYCILLAIDSSIIGRQDNKAF